MRMKAAIVTILAAAGVARAEPSDTRLWEKASTRIQKYRQADGVVSVVGAGGQAVPGAVVAIEQTRHAFLFGCNIFLWGRVGSETDEEAYRTRFHDLLNYATLPFYWPSYEPRQGHPNHQRTERIARWCRDNRIATKGHPLAWNYADPRWLPDDLAEIRNLQMARIQDCVSRFAGLIDRWDVVNEPTHFDRQAFQRRAPKMTAMWSQAGRLEFVRACFDRAHRANPRAALLINDYRVDPDYAAVIEKLVDGQGQPMYDVIGIQSHMHGGTWTNEKIWEVCERFARFGVPLHFTETTIVSGRQGWELRREGGEWASTAEGEARQAREVERFYTMLFSHPAVEAITWWDFSDRRAWQGAPAGLLRKDLTPKPAYATLMKLVKDRWWTRLVVRTDKNGHAKFRGFLGDYQVKVTDEKGTAVMRPMALSRTGDNRLTVRIP